MAYEITHSLLSSWKYALKENPFEDATSTDDPFAEFLSKLRREPSEPNEAMATGLAFETEIENIAKGNSPDEPTFEASSKISELVKGGAFQYATRKATKIRGLEIMLNGRLDVLRAGIIYDFKYTKNYERGKFFDSTQHPMYFALVPEAREFTYIASNGTDVWTETYDRDQTPSIKPVISDFLEWLESVGLLDTYKEYWEVK